MKPGTSLIPHFNVIWLSNPFIVLFLWLKVIFKVKKSISMSKKARVMCNTSFAWDLSENPFRVIFCWTVLAQSLTLLFEMNFTSGHIPVQWKQGNVVPLHKKGDKSQVSNYRPISLLCIVSKVVERYIYNNVLKVVEPIINTNQIYEQEILYYTIANCLW